jgi:flagellar hook-basal body complex protein FliE
MAVGGIGNVLSSVGFTPPVSSPSATNATGAVDPTNTQDGNTFTNMLDGLQASQNNADSLAVQAATGNLTDIHSYTIAATEAQLMTDLTVAVRDRAVEAFNEIMRMQA